MSWEGFFFFFFLTKVVEELGRFYHVTLSILFSILRHIYLLFLFFSFFVLSLSLIDRNYYNFPVSVLVFGFMR